MSEASALWLPSAEDVQARATVRRTLALATAPAGDEWRCDNCDTPNTQRKRCRDCGTSRW